MLAPPRAVCASLIVGRTEDVVVVALVELERDTPTFETGLDEGDGLGVGFETDVLLLPVLDVLDRLDVVVVVVVVLVTPAAFKFDEDLETVFAGVVLTEFRLVGEAVVVVVENTFVVVVVIAVVAGFPTDDVLLLDLLALDDEVSTALKT